MSPAPDRTNSALLKARLTYQAQGRTKQAYAQALADARRAGCTYTEIASTLGITRQAVRQYALTN